MANKKHVELLNKGVAEWNEWRLYARAHPSLDLGGADLRSADLRMSKLDDADLRSADLRDAALHGATLSRAKLGGAILSGASVIRANLSGADLTSAIVIRANLSGADLTSANLSGADLTNADLTGANLTSAILTSANLTSANLTKANLTSANLTSANLTGAALMRTLFGDVDLTSVIGLEKCTHHGPSMIDYRILERSKSLPLPFLRGIGLPDNLIEYLPSLLNQAFQHYSCFISYSTKDQEVAERLYTDLQNKGVRCWFAPHDLPIGAKTWDAIDEAIKLRDKLLLILSKNSIASDWVEDEVQKAFAEERDRKQPVLFPVRIDDAVMETPEPWARKLRDQRNIGDFRRWEDHDAYKNSFGRVMRDLTKLAPSSSHP
jgi:TIR domain/Pentapeptide repeats (8 copies)